MDDVLKILVMFQRNSRTRQIKHDRNESCIRKSQQRGWNFPSNSEKADPILKHLFKSNAVLSKGLELQLVENESCICHEGKLVIPKPLQRRATIWYHHYLQHPGHTRLEEETMKAVIYWKGMRTTFRSIMKSCKTCQMNKKRSLKYGHLPSKIVICIPWEALCVNLIGPYTLKGKDGS